MVKIIRSFRFVYPVDKKNSDILGAWDNRLLVIRGTASIVSQGPHPVLGGWYRVPLSDGTLIIDINIQSIREQGSDEELIQMLQQNQYYEVLQALTELTREFNRAKFLS